MMNERTNAALYNLTMNEDLTFTLTIKGPGTDDAYTLAELPLKLTRDWLDCLENSGYKLSFIELTDTKETNR